ncbi:MAG: hypothetical protein MHMPM18_002525 [Marteilia pararefringens]
MIADEPQQRRLLRDDDHRDQQQKEDIIGGVATAVQPSDDQVSPTPSPSVEVDETEEAASASCPAAAVVEQNGGTNCNPTSTPSAAAAAHSNGASRHRVKVYLRTNVEKDWNENGTGNLILGVEEKETKMGPSQGELKSLHVISEIDGNYCIRHGSGGSSSFCCCCCHGDFHCGLLNYYVMLIMKHAVVKEVLDLLHLPFPTLRVKK